MKVKPAIAAVLVFGVVVLGYAYIRSYPPFTSQSVRIGVDESRRTITFAEFFADPFRAVPESTRNAMVQAARVPPVEYVALIDYQAQDSVGAIIRERATCSYYSLEGRDAPTRTYWVKIDSEYNMEWAKRQPANLQRRMLENM
jgi:hypothetical protein